MSWLPRGAWRVLSVFEAIDTRFAGAEDGKEMACVLVKGEEGEMAWLPIPTGTSYGFFHK